MPCEAPLRAYTTANGGRVKFFTRNDAAYYQEPYNGLLVPCGKCLLCKTEQARQTSIRLIHEGKQHRNNSFLTLTYDNQHIPEHGSLQYNDLHCFLKRLRYHFGTLRYFAVGEYGDKTSRPHYHVCIFGLDFVNHRIITQSAPYMLWVNPALDAIWKKGMCTIGGFTNETALYCASYVQKKLHGSKRRYVRIDEETGELIAVEQPRAFMSDNLGKDWFGQWKQGLIDHDRVIIDARPQKPPKAYDRWLNEIEPEAVANWKEKRTERARKKAKTPEQIRAHARNARARAEKRQKAKSV